MKREIFTIFCISTIINLSFGQEIKIMENKKNQLLIIDGHSHVTLPITHHIELMDEAGINKTILFRTLIHPENKKNIEQIKAEMLALNSILTGDPVLARHQGEASAQELYEAIKEYPDRFIGFGNVPLNLSVDSMVEYINEEVIGRRFVGLGEFTLPSGEIGQLENVFNASSQTKNLPIWIHTFNPLTLVDIQQISELAYKYPTVPVIIGHMGGSNWLETIDIIKKHPNMYVDLSAYYSTFVLGIVIQELPDRCIFGIDYPYGDMLLARKTIERICPDKLLQEKVLGGNILKLLNMTF